MIYAVDSAIQRLNNRGLNFCDIRVSYAGWSLSRELLKQYSTEKRNGYLQSGCSRVGEVVAKEKGSLEES